MFTKLFDPYFQWWQSGATRYLDMFMYQPSLMKGFGQFLERYLESKRVMDRMLEEMWRNLRLPPLDELVRIHERLNLIESKWVSLQEQWEVEDRAVIMEDLKFLKEALERVRQEIHPSPEQRNP